VDCRTAFIHVSIPQLRGDLTGDHLPAGNSQSGLLEEEANEASNLSESGGETGGGSCGSWWFWSAGSGCQRCMEQQQHQW
jgi:hypothetical protein